MIQSLRITTGYPSRLPGIGGRTHAFEDRINVLFGPNGAGKTTLLRTLAVCTGCGEGGWSDHGAPQDPGYKVRLRWNGDPVFYQDCYSQSEQSFLGGSYLEEHEVLRSTGEKRIGLINELIDYLEERFLTHVVKKSGERPTLLLDEVDNHIGFAGQAVLWKEIFPRLSKKYQLIISTHSIFPVLLRTESSFRSDNIIELSPYYRLQCLQALGEAIEHYNKVQGLE
ncbi:MAG: AAA family ATPase [Spirochaetaceae bacterium]|nr:MAG: AAA family ATPase [Spirochaetaceae bacterium]